MREVSSRSIALVAAFAWLSLSCGTEEAPPAPSQAGIHDFANGCYAIGEGARFLETVDQGQSYAFSARDFADSSRFFMKPSDLGTYLLYDAEGRYLVAEDGRLSRQAELLSDVLTIDDSYVSEAEWLLEGRLLRHLKSGQYLTKSATLAPDAESAAVLALYPTDGCSEHPELSLDAKGEVVSERFSDGAVFGIVDTHSHLLTNFAFGGGGIFHGAPFHRLGVRHALPDCALFHGEEGRKDLLGFGYENGLGGELDASAFLPPLLFGSLWEF